MARDYASQNQRSKKRKSHTGNDGLPGWLWAFVGLSLGLCVAAVVFIMYRPVERSAQAPAQEASVKATPAPQASSPDIPPREEARFKFYRMLPQSEVLPSEDPYTPEPQEEAKKSTARYVIQAGSFRDADDAERRKANLALIGVESTVKEVKVDGKGTRYRIQIGPAMDYHKAEKTMRLLADNDIDSFATRSN